MKSKENKIVITGMGVLSPFGAGIDTFWDGLIEGRCGVRKITQFPVEDNLYPCKIASEVPQFDCEPRIPSDDPAFSGRYLKLALTALGMAIGDGYLTDETDILRSASLYVGSAGQTGDKIEEFIALWAKEESAVLPADTFSCIDPYAVVSAASRIFNLGHKAYSITASCCSGVLALLMCVERLKTGKSNIGLVIGADSISPLIFLGVGLTGELSKRNDDPARASRPFDSEQDGYILGEGAVALVIETESHARSRGARIYAELGTIAATNDASSFKFIDEKGTQMGRGMAMTLDQIPANQIDYISAHAPSIVALDIAESAAIRRAFGKHADRIPVTSIKGAIGNPSAAGGMLQIVSGILSIQDGIIPPTINLENPLPGCDLDYVNRAPRHKEINTVFISAHGGGGFNASLTIHACNQ